MNHYLKLFLKWLIFSVVLSLAGILILSLIAYKGGFDQKKITYGIYILYVTVNLAVGAVIGRNAKKRRFLWGFASGTLYFLVLLIIGSILSQSFMKDAAFALAYVLCAAGGMAGGMLVRGK